MNDELLIVWPQQLRQSSQSFYRHPPPQLLLLEVVHVEIGNDHVPLLFDSVLIPL